MCPCAGADDDRVGARGCGHLYAGRGHDGTGRITLRDASHGLPDHRQRHRRPSRRCDLAAGRRRDAAHEGRPEESNTGYAQGGIAAAVGADDSSRPSLCRHHGRGRRPVRRRGGARAGRRRPSLRARAGGAGARGSIATTHGGIALAREAAHAVRRVLHAADATGRELSRALWVKASASAAARGATTTRRRFSCSSRTASAPALAPHRRRRPITDPRRCPRARRAAGHRRRRPGVQRHHQSVRCHRRWRVPSRGAPARGWLDMEFVQFHPTALDVPGTARALLSEALRGEGARLINGAGERFTSRYDPAGDLAPRDRVARAIVLRAAPDGRAGLPLAGPPRCRLRARRFPTASSRLPCGRAGSRARPAFPSDPRRTTSWAASRPTCGAARRCLGCLRPGEVACTGVHGANRLASNSLLEGLVFGARAAAAMQQTAAGGAPGRAHPRADVDSRRRSRRALPAPSVHRSRRPWPDVGRRRTAARRRPRLPAPWPRSARSRRRWPGPASDAGRPDERRLANLVTVGRLMAQAALRRTESRGGHYRADFPCRDDVHWTAHIAERSRN